MFAIDSIAINDGETWNISNYLGVPKLRNIFWKELVKKAGLLLGFVDATKVLLSEVYKNKVIDQ